MKDNLNNIIRLFRVDQYIKNFFIFLPLFFALKITETELLINAAIAFFAFSMAASAIYIFNDYRDIEEDKLHPKKKYRPLASGAIDKHKALWIMTGLFVSGLAIMACLSPTTAGILLAYVIMNLAYSFYFKQVAIIDIVIIAIGFVLRLFVGSAVTGIPLSMWIIVMTFLLALFLALAKRRDDCLIFLDTGKSMRKVVNGYNLQFLNTAMGIMASVVIVAYINYTTSTEVIERVHSHDLYLTAFFVILGILRYLQIAFVLEDSSSPTKIVLKDRFMQITLFGWIITFIWILY